MIVGIIRRKPYSCQHRLWHAGVGQFGEFGEYEIGVIAYGLRGPADISSGAAAVADANFTHDST